MHPNPTFRKTPKPDALAFAKARGFGVLCINGTDTPLSAHIPFLMPEPEVILAHLVASNPIWHALKQGPLKAAFNISGADGYISPDWYGIENQVPTWNYVAVNLRGTLSARPQSELRATIDALSQEFESRLAPKVPWHSAKMDPEILDRMMRQIRPIHFEIEQVDCTFKLGQNKLSQSRLSAADALGKSSIGLETETLAAMMRSVTTD